MIKEFYQTAQKSKKIVQDLSHISPKLQKYLYESEDIARIMQENEQELSLDFTTVENFVIHLSEEKPLIFILRGAQHLKKRPLILSTAFPIT